jgi:hypothetical protein
MHAIRSMESKSAVAYFIFGDDKSAGNPVSALNGVEATPSIMSLR